MIPFFFFVFSISLYLACYLSALIDDLLMAHAIKH